MNKNLLHLRYLKIVVVGISFGLISSPLMSHERFPSQFFLSNSLAQSTPLENDRTSPTPSTVPTPSSPAPTPTASPTAPPTPTTNDQLLIGSWQAKDERGDTLTLTFQEKGKLILEFSVSSGSNSSYINTKKAEYRTFPPDNFLDLIFENNKTIQTIFEIKSEGKKLRIPLKGLTYQTDRPTTIEPTQVREFTRVEPTNSSK